MKMWNRIRLLLDRMASGNPARTATEPAEFGEALVGDRRLIDTARRLDQWRSARSAASTPAAAATTD
jgi:hypothetical protein